MAGNKNSGIGSGGKRAGAGRKNKPLADKILEGNPGKRALKKIEFENGSVDVPEVTLADFTASSVPKPKEYLTAKQKQGELIAEEVRTEVWLWLKERRCDHLIPMLLVDQYAMSYARWVQAEQARSEFGSLSKHPTTGNAQQSPFIVIAQNESKQALNIWRLIYDIVAQNCTVEMKIGMPDKTATMKRLLGHL